jgi:hypothetical protein
MSVNLMHVIGTDGTFGSPVHATHL